MRRSPAGRRQHVTSARAPACVRFGGGGMALVPARGWWPAHLLPHGHRHLLAGGAPGHCGPPGPHCPGTGVAPPRQLPRLAAPPLFLEERALGHCRNPNHQPVRCCFRKSGKMIGEKDVLHGQGLKKGSTSAAGFCLSDPLL
ncbi:hypothetical protein BS78_06G273200 [Paspalum vaginatum]|nr:hypothetical protein BS78_06G273200 [Paspalum vaginatum]